MGNQKILMDREVSSIEIFCKFIVSTPRAICIKEMDSTPGVWIPRSQILYCDKDLDAVEKESYLTITIPEWLAVEKGLV